MERKEIDNIVTNPMRVISRPMQVALPVPLGDWNRLMVQIESCRASFQLWAIAYSVFFAIGVTAGLSIIPLMVSQPPIWALTIHIVICAVGLAVGLALVVSERALARRQHSAIDQLIADMKRVRDTFTESQDG